MRAGSASPVDRVSVSRAPGLGVKRSSSKPGMGCGWARAEAERRSAAVRRRLGIDAAP
ncbi:MAG: hypothetical protein AMXMBFR34_03480 [Myxococcaceae bacterium]